MRACFRCPECDDPGPRARRPAAGRRHAGQPAGPPDRRGHHHHRRTRPPRRAGARTVGADRRGADRAGAPADRAARRRQAAVRDRRRAAADGAARAGQGRSVLRLRGRPAVDRRRPRVGAGIPVRRARHRRRLHAAVGARPRRRTPGASRLPEDGAQAAQALPAHAHLPLRRLREDARCCGWPDATASARTRSTTCCATACLSTCIRWCARASGSAPRTTA